MLSLFLFFFAVGKILFSEEGFNISAVNTINITGKIFTLQCLENGWFTIVVIIHLVKNYQITKK